MRKDAAALFCCLMTLMEALVFLGLTIKQQTLSIKEL